MLDKLGDYPMMHTASSGGPKSVAQKRTLAPGIWKFA
jgi:hypothetical protein